MRIGVGADGDVESAPVGQRCNKFSRIREAVRVGDKPVGSLRRVASKCDDAVHANTGVLIGDRERVFARCVNTGKVRRNIKAHVLMKCCDRFMRQFARGAARAVCDGDKLWVQVRQGADRIPEAKRSL